MNVSDTLKKKWGPRYLQLLEKERIPLEMIHYVVTTATTYRYMRAVFVMYDNSFIFLAVSLITTVETVYYQEKTLEELVWFRLGGVHRSILSLEQVRKPDSLE